MNFEETFPLRYYLNLGREDRRRQTVEAHFFERRLMVDRMPSVKASWLRSAAGYPDTKRRALALTKRLVIRRAMLAGAEAVFLFENDVVLDADWRENASRIRLPDDWGVFMLGAFHEAPPVEVVSGLVRCTHAIDHHAIGIRRTCFNIIRKLWRGGRTAVGAGEFSDQRLAAMQHLIPTYTCCPNLAWQSGDDAHTNYDREGRQLFLAEHVDHLPHSSASA